METSRNTPQPRRQQLLRQATLPPRLRVARKPSPIRALCEVEVSLGDEWVDSRERRKMQDMSRHCLNWASSSATPRERVYSDEDSSTRGGAGASDSDPSSCMPGSSGIEGRRRSHSNASTGSVSSRAGSPLLAGQSSDDLLPMDEGAGGGNYPAGGLAASVAGAGGMVYQAALGDNRAEAPRPLARAASESAHHLLRVGLTEDRPHMVIVMVGLPARGKSFIAKRLKRYLSWSSHKTQTFNAGNERRQSLAGKMEMEANFFDASNKEAAALRELLANRALDRAFSWFESDDGTFAIFDATNTTRARRATIVQRCEERGVSVAFLESICDSREVLEANINQKLATSADYRTQDFKTARSDLLERISQYEKVYETVADDRLSYIKMYNLSSKLLVNRIYGRMAKEVVPFIMALHVGRRPIWLTRSGSCRRFQRRPSPSRRGTKPDEKHFGGGDNEAYSWLIEAQGSNDEGADFYLDESDDDEDEELGKIGVVEGGIRKMRKQQRKRKKAPSRPRHCRQHSHDVTSASSDAAGGGSGPVGAEGPSLASALPLPFATPFYQPDASLDAEGKRYSRALGTFIQERLKYFGLSGDVLGMATPIPAGSTRAAPAGRNFRQSPVVREEPVSEAAPATVGERQPELCILSGTLRRCAETTEDVLRVCATSSSSRQDTALNLMNKGLCTGLSMSQIKEFYPDLYDKWVKDPFHARFPGGESYRDLLQRLQQVVISIEQQTLPVLVVSHTSSLQLLYSYFMQDHDARNDAVAECLQVDIPRHTVVELSPDSSGQWTERRFNLLEHYGDRSSDVDADPAADADHEGDLEDNGQARAQ